MSGAVLRIARTHFPVTALGPGRRFGVWVQGCPLACRGCMSLDTWAPEEGTAIAPAELAGRWREAVRQGATGLTVSGGEPLAQPVALAAFLAAAATGEHDVLIFTGYEPEELDERQRQAASYADVLITGRYDASRPTRLIWRGSANQRMRVRTELGRRRYEPFLELEPERPPLELSAGADGVRLIGVPTRGTLPRLERDLRARGLDAGVTWRPSARP
ncbi:4Fe-4S single cluster domain-containing protein [Actinoplanes sp. NPDC051851]|uniref:4Fe-4S single cluster domain-containing protein n=1 Tax=Actinoplanes sp. NPDC051851 TaxID=3154753 RepID=UPI00341EB6C1